MRIAYVTEDYIEFDNGNVIDFVHREDCCERNYSDFTQLEQLAFNAEFDEELKFEKTEHGFRFGDSNQMFFIPCYTQQNGCYSPDVKIYYNGNEVLSVEDEWIDEW